MDRNRTSPHQRQRPFLTKSRFKTAIECETKLYYAHKGEYPNKKQEDPFLEALAEGGYQVGELAKFYYPGGADIKTLDTEGALRETEKLLQAGRAVIYEAAVKYKNLFIRIDILEKRGNELNLIEVKSKSFDGSIWRDFTGRGGDIKSEWQPYIFDAAFQSYVLQKAYPDFKVNTCIMLADKNARAAVDGLNQKFLISKDDSGRVKIITGDITLSDLGDPILKAVEINELVEKVLRSECGSIKAIPFTQWVHYLADSYENDKKIETPIGLKCKSCEYCCTEEEEKIGLKSGFKECFKQMCGFSDNDFKRPLIFEVWNLSKDRKDDFIRDGKYFLSDIKDVDLPEGTRKERQLIQIKKTCGNDTRPFIDTRGIKNAIDSWTFPLHMIDFETASPAIPFNKGQRPYEGIAFQFSHHVMDEDGAVRHSGEYINTQRGKFPNFDFIKALKNQLESDSGTVFCYSRHENTYLNHIHNQLEEVPEETVPDRDELMDFIKSIAKPSDKNKGKWIAGGRLMFDLCELITASYYHIDMKGSNSIKHVLPAILNSSNYLKQKYSEPIYGRGLEIESLNYDNWRWVIFDSMSGRVTDPYKLLPPVFADYDRESLDEVSLLSSPELAEGGAAMTAYSRMQFSEMSDMEREAVTKALLKYCELDTFAMVMICEYFMH